jgi:WD40 repeat protein
VTNQMTFLEGWRAKLPDSLATFAKLATDVQDIDFTHGILATSILWPIRESIQDFEGDAIDTVRQIVGVKAKYVLKAIQSWGDDRLEAARLLAAQAFDNSELDTALTALIEHFDAAQIFAALLAKSYLPQSGGDTFTLTEQIKAALVNVGGITNIQSLTVKLNLVGATPPETVIPRGPPRIPFMVEDLPDDYVARPKDFEQLIAHLLDERRNEPATTDQTVTTMVALRGAGGYGKTTLAKAICHDERIRQVFSNGILWVTLGENPGDLTGRVEDLIYTLSGERFDFTGIDAATARFVELLAEHDLLLVIDDVWNKAHLKPFIQGGSHCARLITTRDITTLPHGVKRVDVDAMRRNEAAQLLGAGLPTSARTALRALAARLGEWPLLLKLVNGSLREQIDLGLNLDQALAEVDAELTEFGLTAFDAQNPAERDQAVAATLGVSLTLLSNDERARYRELALFPEDTDIPLVTLEKLWNATGSFKRILAKRLCRRLFSLSLLLAYDPAKQIIRLHKVVRYYLAQEHIDKLSGLHGQLLDVHCPSPSHDWADLPSTEPYLWDYLAYHLVAAGREAELIATVKDLRYLAAKAHVRNALAAEGDLLIAESHAPEDTTLRLLRRHYVQAGHLLNRCKQLNDLTATLYSRLQHLAELAPLTQRLKHSLTPPYLTPWNTLPDLPPSTLMRTLSGHEFWVRGCAISADGAVIVSASWDGTLRIWDARTGAERFMLTGHTDLVNDCAISADGMVVVSASKDHTLKVWDAPTGTERFTLTGHTNWVWGCAISADGAVIVSASKDSTLKTWDGHTGDERFTLTGHTAPLNDCAISADGTTIVSASEDHTLKVWDVQTGAERFTLTGHMAEVRSCAINEDGSIIVSVSRDGVLKVWDGRQGTERSTLAGQTPEMQSCAVNADGTVVVGGLKVWDMQRGTARLTLTGHMAAVNDCAISADGTIIVSASDDHTLKVWDIHPGTERLPFVERATAENDCAISADGSVVVSASEDHTLKVWDMQRGTARLTLRGHEAAVLGCAVSVDGAMVVSASEDHTLKVWDMQRGTARLTLRGHEAAVNSCAISQNGTIVVSASWDHTLKIWTIATGDDNVGDDSKIESLTLRGHMAPVFDCVINADGTTIVSASDDYTLKVWNAHTGDERFTLVGHRSSVWGCAISGNGTTIVSASADSTLKIWNIAGSSDMAWSERKAERLTLAGHTAPVNGCAISPDETLIASASSDHTLRIWDAYVGTCLVTFPVDGLLFDCAWSPDGQHIVAVGDGGVYFLCFVRREM